MPETPANSTAKRAAALLAIVAAAWLCYAGGRHELAGHYTASSNPADWDRGARIEPDNPDNWYRLGRYRHLDFDNADIPLAISYYRRAIQLDSTSPYYKLDLASALELEGNDAEADADYRAAQAAYPISPEVSWKYGNFLLRQNRLPEAFAEIHRAEDVDPSLVSLAVSRVWHSDPDIHALLDQVLPATPAAYRQALNYLADEKNSSAALEVWNRLIAKEPHPEMKWVFKLTDLLLAQEKFDEAGTVWRQTIGRESRFETASRGESLIYDGGFEKDIAGGGFGWRQTDVPGANFDFDSDEKHSGSRSAQVTFDGSKNLAYENLFQYVLVSPNTRYRFQGFLRTDQISTDSGVRFEILDPNDLAHLDVFTANETGTQPWKPEDVDFTTGPHTHLIVVRLARRPSERLDNKIRGTVWIDDLAIFSGDAGDAPRKTQQGNQSTRSSNAN